MSLTAFSRGRDSDTHLLERVIAEAQVRRLVRKRDLVDQLERDAALAAAGYTVVRVTWRQLVDAPEAVVARLASALAARA